MTSEIIRQGLLENDEYIMEDRIEQCNDTTYFCKTDKFSVVWIHVSTMYIKAISCGRSYTHNFNLPDVPNREKVIEIMKSCGFKFK